MPDAHSATPRSYLIGGGIASLAAAAFLIRDGDVRGQDITIIEAGDVFGGSLDGAGTPEAGYVLRGGRMLESKYLCTYGLFATIPTLDGGQSVTQEILSWNETLQTSSKSRLFADGQRQLAPEFGLSERHILTIERLAIEPEAMLGRTSIQEQFDAAFFRTNFWLMWCTTFAFQPWHSAVEFKRYLVRFSHMVGGFNRLEGIMRTRLNQYDSMVRPLQKWLEERGVEFRTNTRVADLGSQFRAGRHHVTSIEYESNGRAEQTPLGEADRVIVTLGSMTDAASLGTMETAPALLGKPDGDAWRLWERLAEGRPEFGNPSVFDSHVEQSKWVSFTITLHDPALLRLVREATGNIPGEGGLVTFPKSGWLCSIVIPHQPHFIGQPEDVGVLWGYGLRVDAPGDFITKPMSACTGREILQEVLGQLGITAEAETILKSSICVPCMMPFITSQFLCRGVGDRPAVLPAAWANLALVGQFCELPEDVVFTVEYSIRSAQVAVYGLLGIKRAPPDVYRGAFDPRVLYRAFMALHDMPA